MKILIKLHQNPLLTKLTHITSKKTTFNSQPGQGACENGGYKQNKRQTPGKISPVNLQKPRTVKSSFSSHPSTKHCHCNHSSEKNQTQNPLYFVAKLRRKRASKYPINYQSSTNLTYLETVLGVLLMNLSLSLEKPSSTHQVRVLTS